MIPAVVTSIAEDTGHSPRAWVDVDLDAGVANARRIAEVSGARLLPMVKANGYGLGAVPVVRALEPLDPWGFGVATVEEGAELRSAGVGRPVVVFTPVIAPWIEAMIRHDLRPVIGDIAALDRWLAAAPGRPFHIGIDSGMARAGIAHDDHATLAAARERLAGVAAYEGLASHFHSADTDAASMEVQDRRFHAAAAALGPRPPLVHMANSAAALQGRRFAADLVRPGIYLYGGCAGVEAPRPVAALRAVTVAVRRIAPGASVSYGATWHATGPTRLATVAIGYADGVPRSLSNRGVVELGGARVPIRGRVTMDMILVEAPDAVQIGDVATIFGGLVTLDEQAELAGTISYELLTSLGRRVRRRYGGLP
jgi:alanine racemase